MLKQVLTNQYNKCFTMLSDTIRNYNEELWFDKTNYKSPVWQMVYHALFYANIYCSASEKSILHWEKEKENYEIFGKTPWPPYKEVILTESYSKSEILEFLEFIKNKVPVYLEDMQPEAKCWPDWYDESQLEFQINNIRHIQHHTAEIIERHDIAGGFRYNWQ